MPEDVDLVFIGGFFPIIGAFVSGLLAVAVSFVSGGLTDALIILAVVITRSITGPITQAMAVANTMARGDMTHRMTIDYENEIGQLAASLNMMAT